MITRPTRGKSRRTNLKHIARNFVHDECNISDDITASSRWLSWIWDRQRPVTSLWLHSFETPKTSLLFIINFLCLLTRTCPSYFLYTIKLYAIHFSLHSIVVSGSVQPQVNAGRPFASISLTPIISKVHRGRWDRPSSGSWRSTYLSMTSLFVAEKLPDFLCRMQTVNHSSSTLLPVLIQPRLKLKCDKKLPCSSCSAYTI